MDDLLNFIQVVVFTFQFSRDFYIRISLNIFVNFPMMVEIGERNIHVYNHFLNLIWRINHFHFKKTHFVIIRCKKILLCFVWDGNL